MDIPSNTLFSLTQLSEEENVVVFENSSVDVIFNHIQKEPKHGQRIVVLNLDETLLSQKCAETIEIIQKLQTENCLVIGFTQTNPNSADTLANLFLEKDIDFNKGIFKDFSAPYQSKFKNGLFKHGIMFVTKEQKERAFKALFKNLETNLDDVYWLDNALTYAHDYHHALTQHASPITPMPLTLFSSNEHIRENKYFKIESSHKKNNDKPHVFFWLNHKKDLECIDAYFLSAQHEPKIKFGFYSFKPECPILASRITVPLEQASSLLTFLYKREVLNQEDVETANKKIVAIYSTKTCRM